jgi:putative DNA primase/helicase
MQIVSELIPTLTRSRPDGNVESQSRGLASDTDAAARFVEHYGPRGNDTVRYCVGIGWLVWNGLRWYPDAEGLQVQELAKDAAKAWTAACMDSYDGDRAKLVKAALAFESKQHIQAVLTLAKSEDGICIDASELDADPYLLNVANGEIDLRTGELRAHDKSSYCSKLVPVPYDPAATNGYVDKVLDTIRKTCGEDMPDFLARCFGYCLTGDVSADVLFLLQGDGGAGKTTLLEANLNLLGDYAVKLPFTSFLSSGHGASPGGARSDLMRLRGARLAIAAEGERSAVIDAGTLKSLTGGDKVAGRELYRSSGEFPPTHKLWLSSNFEPHADSDDSGLWRRFVDIRFMPIPPEDRDPEVKRALMEDAGAKSALLAWAVRGCVDWLSRGGGRKGLAIPASVEALTAAYRARLDTVGQWLNESFEGKFLKDTTAAVSNKELRQDYDEWCRDNGAFALGLTRFGDALKAHGLVGEHSKWGRRWRGIRRETSY